MPIPTVAPSPSTDETPTGLPGLGFAELDVVAGAVDALELLEPPELEDCDEEPVCDESCFAPLVHPATSANAETDASSAAP
ncbi:MAG: hypothetical protein ACR2KJ_12115 [Jatrophihabitans sp.]